MTTTVTERDKKLLYFVALGAFLFVFVRFLLLPALAAHAAAAENLAVNETLRESIESSLPQATAAAQEKANAREAITASSADYYAKLSNSDLDALTTGLALRHSLRPLALTITEPTPPSLTGGLAEPNDAQTDEQADFFTTAGITLRASGSQDDFFALLDDLSANYPSVQLQGFSLEEQRTADADGKVAATSLCTVRLNVVMCDKEEVPTP